MKRSLEELQGALTGDQLIDLLNDFWLWYTSGGKDRLYDGSRSMILHYMDERAKEDMHPTDFSWALQQLKEGRKMYRNGWNSTNQFIFLMPGYPDGVPANGPTSAALNIEQGETIYVRPYIMMCTVSDELVPWIATQSDVLADDWAAK